MVFFDVTDNAGCQIIDSLFINQPGELDIEYTVINPGCYGMETGSIVIDTVYNYQGNYNDILYFWNPNLNGSFNNILTGVSAEFIEVKILDLNNCERIFDFTLENPDSMYFDQIGLINCINGSDGQVFASVTGGGNNAGSGTNYIYLWTEVSTGLTSNNSTWGNLDAGTFTALVTITTGVPEAGLAAEKSA